MFSILIQTLVGPGPMGVLVQGISEANSEGFPDWANYGIAGLVVIGLLGTRTIVAGWQYKEMQAAHALVVAELKTELREVRVDAKAMTQQMIEQSQTAIPALAQASSVIEDSLPIIRDALRMRDQQQGGG